jgi:hypothetical protein
MANQIIPAQDIFGLGRLSEALRMNRQERRQQQIDEQNAITRGLQQQGMQLGIKEQEQRLSDLARMRETQQGAIAAMQSAPEGTTPELARYQYLLKNAPDQAQAYQDQIIDRATKIGRFNPAAGLQILNQSIGTDFELQAVEKDKIQVGSPSSGKVMFLDPSTLEVVKQFSFDTSQGTGPKYQLKEGVDESGNTVFFSFNPEAGTLPAGIRPKLEQGETIETTPDGGVKITRGGTRQQLQERKFQVEQHEKEKADAKRTENALTQAETVVDKVDQVLGQIGLGSAGAGSLFSIIPGTPARDLKANIETLKANLAFNALQGIREASKTGGALGAVSERELSLLESQIASLDASQSPEQLRRNLGEVRKSFEKIIENAKNKPQERTSPGQTGGIKFLGFE